MVEVLKTNVSNPYQAVTVIDQIHRTFPEYEANFDLDDCDKILRIESMTTSIQSVLIITLLKNFGFDGGILADEQPIEDGSLLYVRREMLN